MPTRPTQLPLPKWPCPSWLAKISPSEYPPPGGYSEHAPEKEEIPTAYQTTELYRKLAKRFSSLCAVPITAVDTDNRRIDFTESTSGLFFCSQCPNRCRLLPTMLYGCNEARRWHGKYIFYCPIGLVFSSVLIPETDLALIAGPVVMGDLQDTLFDLPDGIDHSIVSQLFCCTADTLNHISSILEMAIFGLRYRPDQTAYDRNIVPGVNELPAESAAVYNSFPYISAQEEALREAVTQKDKAEAKALLNEMLRFVYNPHPDQFALIQSRAVHLVFLLSQVALAGGMGDQEQLIYLTEYIPTLKSLTSLEALDGVLAEILHHFIDYTFDFSEIVHSDTVYRIMDFVKSNYNLKITMNHVANYVHLSNSHTGNIFHRETGMTVSAYINHVRIEKSKPLLKQSSVPIADIAFLCGFEDHSYFTRVFKKQTGISPRRFREQYIASEGTEDSQSD